ncbi:Glycosyl hydrolases family 16 [Klenkia soli]|uniref:Glycosyl hydrolases family 16 n=1 Tax=Klenkia soli TaxID=1052260 RepID=A0A1H0TYP0_9ACTN|nr:glycoside hydrolase family 16 protein [Klenkia soli]SDP58890.1 Glycosyl hydrolases family 16 [Klenkia soli]
MHEDFDGPELDPAVWTPHYLPMWSSRAATAAAYRLADSQLVLSVPVDHPVWLPEDHDPPLRVSGIQSGNRSGPVGSTSGQQEVFPGQRVREEQPRSVGHLVSAGHVEITCAMHLSPRSMAALWLCGFEEVPAESGEICVVEVFGDAVDPGVSAEVGIGLKPIRDPHLAADFAAPRLPVDVAEPHTYAVDWDASEAVFRVDGEVVRRCAAPPTYPLQLMVAVFDFPARSDGTDGHLVPELVVDAIVSRPA